MSKPMPGAEGRGGSVSSPELGGLWQPPDDPATLP
jgi:hypothetical protein